MPLWRCRAVFPCRAVVVCLALALGLPARVGAQHWSIKGTDAPLRWRTCRLVAPEYSGPCRVTFLTRGNGAINLHFDLDDSGTEGLSFVIPSQDLQTSERMEVLHVAQRFRRNTLEATTGVCVYRADSIRCVSDDGTFSAQAVGRLR